MNLFVFYKLLLFSLTPIVFPNTNAHTHTEKEAHTNKCTLFSRVFEALFSPSNGSVSAHRYTQQEKTSSWRVSDGKRHQAN